MSATLVKRWHAAGQRPFLSTLSQLFAEPSPSLEFAKNSRTLPVARRIRPSPLGNLSGNSFGTPSREPFPTFCFAFSRISLKSALHGGRQHRNARAQQIPSFRISRPSASISQTQGQAPRRRSDRQCTGCLVLKAPNRRRMLTVQNRANLARRWAHSARNWTRIRSSGCAARADFRGLRADQAHDIPPRIRGLSAHLWPEIPTPAAPDPWASPGALRTRSLGPSGDETWGGAWNSRWVGADHTRIEFQEHVPQEGMPRASDSDAPLRAPRVVLIWVNVVGFLYSSEVMRGEQAGAKRKVCLFVLNY